MRIATILGTRPEIIRLSRVIEQLDQRAEHILIHTGQNYSSRLSDVFFQELGVRAPDVCLGVEGASFGAQIGAILERCERVLLERHPDRVLILGDTNSGMAAIVARRLGIPVYHMEAGNRCFDDRVPEEVNRRIIDHSSSVLLPYTNRSRENLVREGIANERIFVTGNPIYEVILHYERQIEASPVMQQLGVREKAYFLLTMHRAENVDVRARLEQLLEAFEQLSKKYRMPVICSLHPRTRDRANKHGIRIEREGLRFLEPLGFFDFIKLERSAFCVISDSGTVQEEACIFRQPSVTIRDVTERPETIECGGNILSGVEPKMIIDSVEAVTGATSTWQPPAEYMETSVAKTVCNIVLGYRLPDLAETQWRGQVT
jgi:UDP-N-acetylglucosamine 2-epimerase (non-hydrolysing)